MKDKKEKYADWERELLEFVNSDPVTPPELLTEKLKITVSQDLKPDIWKIFSKLAGMQAAYATKSGSQKMITWLTWFNTQKDLAS